MESSENRLEKPPVWFSLWNSEISLHFCCHCSASGQPEKNPNLTPQSYQPQKKLIDINSKVM